MAPRCRARASQAVSSSSSSSSSAAAATGTSGETRVGTSAGAGGGGLTTEQRAVAVARCMSPGEGCRSELRSKAVLALANAASFPFSEGLRGLVQARICGGGG